MKTNPYPSGTRRGFAITIVLLVTVVAILAFLFSTATLTVASRSSAAQERNAAQALLAADSGLRTLNARAATTPYTASYENFTAWIEGNFTTLDLGDGIEATLDVLDETEDEVMVQSTGVAGTARRVLVQSFRIVSGPPLPALVNVPGALTSVGSVDSNSASALVAGRENTDAEWTYLNVDLCAAATGEYVETSSGVVYQVIDEEPLCGEPVAVRSTSGTETTLPGDTDITLRPTAIAEDLTVVDGISTVRVTPGTRSLFGFGTPISIGTGSGIVTAVDEDADGNPILTIDWNLPGMEPAVANEGAVVRREVVSAVTNGTCDLGNKGDETFPDGCQPGQDLSELFLKTFGITQDQMFSSLEPAQILQGSDITASRELSGITWVQDPDTNFRDQTGSGILIVEANAGQQMTLNVSNSFVGLVYVIGDAKIAGNGDFSRNAIVVDGVATLDVDVQGTTNIAYDPLAILRAVAGITFPNPEAGALGAAVENTWRIR